MKTRFWITKTADGGYRWTGISSTNAKDRDQEIVSKMSLELDVHRTKEYGDTSELRLFHIKGTRLGGAPDYRTVVNGVLVESGDFDDTPFARGVAEYMSNHPKANDGSGWGMSIGFNGNPDHAGVYKQIETVERSVLPTSQAANPWTSFSLEKEDDMAIKPAQRQLLDAITKEVNDPEFAAVASQIMQAAEVSKSLDEDGVRRKDVTSTNAQYAHGEGGLLNTPGTGSKKPKKTNGKASKKDDGDNEQDGDESDPTAAHGNTKCASCGHTASEHERSKAAGYGACMKCKCTGFKMVDTTDDAEKDVDDDTDDGEKKKSLSDFSLDDLLDAIAEHTKSAVSDGIETSPVVKQLVAINTELAHTVAELTEKMAELESGEEQVKAHFEKPRLLTSMLASRSKGTQIGENDPLAKAANDKTAETSGEFAQERTGADSGNIFANPILGFVNGKGN